LAGEHGVHPLQIGKWKKELIDGAESLFVGKKDRKQDNSCDQEALEKKVGRLTMENDFLKKKLGY
jgi:transposase-like protein